MENLNKIVRFSRQKEALYNSFADRFKKANEQLKVVDPSIEISLDEIKQTIENPPKRPPFPFILAILISTIEVVDALELALGWTGIYSFLYGTLRLCVTIYLYYWAIKSISGVKLIGVKRKLLKGIGRRFLIATLSNLPIPYIGIILRLFPMDLVFVLLTYFDNTKAVKLIWLALGQERNFDVYVNVIRNKTGQSDLEVTKSIKRVGESSDLS